MFIRFLQRRRHQLLVPPVVNQEGESEGPVQVYFEITQVYNRRPRPIISDDSHTSPALSAAPEISTSLPLSGDTDPLPAHLISIFQLLSERRVEHASPIIELL